MTAIPLRSKGVDETHAVAAAVASVARRGDLILLVGELGAGKTAFVQGFARSLGITSHVTSPTFTLVNPSPMGVVTGPFSATLLRRIESRSGAGSGLCLSGDRMPAS